MNSRKKISIFFIFGLLAIYPVKFLLAAAYYYANPDKVKELDSQVKNLNQDIVLQKNKIEQRRKQQDEYLEALRQKQSESATLANQIAIADNKIKKVELDIEDLNIDINFNQLEVQKTAAEIEDANVEIEKKEESLAVALRSIDKKWDASLIEILILNDNLSDFLNQVKYLEDINSNLKKSLSDLGIERRDLEEKKQGLAKKEGKLQDLKAQMSEKIANLDGEKQAKADLLDETKSSEEEYARLLQETKAEQLRAQAEIAEISRQVKNKMAEIEKNKVMFSDNGFVWPVPKNTITAFFHDPSYPFRNIFEHPAVDISARQGTEIRAAASGYVAKARDNGMGYSYIMLVHGNNIATVYGHVSKIYVQNDQYVKQGQIIGLSGGKPGTPGAGPLTTGSHLHLEFRLDGIPVNPLKYLP